MGNLGVDVPTLNVYLSQQRITGVPGAPKVTYTYLTVFTSVNKLMGLMLLHRIFTSSIVKDSFLLGPRFLHVLGGGELPLEFSW